MLEPVKPIAEEFSLPRRLLCPRSLSGVLARAWLLCLLLSLLEWLTPLAFNNRGMSSGLHCGIWLLSPFVAQRLPKLKWLPQVLWGSLLLSLTLGLLLCLWLFGLGIISLSHQYHFFFGTNDSHATWKTEYIYARRNGAVVARQGCQYWSLQGINARHSRTVRIRPLTPLMNWITPAEEDHPTGWTVVDKKAVYFSPDSTRQYQADAQQAGQQRCWQEQQRLDSTAGPAPRLELPAATQRGAGTLGFELAGKVWRNFGHCFDGKVCADYCPARVSGVLENGDPANPIYSFRIMTELRAGPARRQRLSLWLTHVKGPGVYEANSPSDARKDYNLELYDEITDSLYSQASALGNPEQWTGPTAQPSQLPDVARVTITRLDADAQILSGTFEGQLRTTDPRAKPLPVRKGRFDVQYHLFR
ncbi:hypothetical protein MUN84_01645 [Hymenobacter sp. 5516J-16]|uniref:hypothetical protein n=1 Tax=Hymenobacter sp. 5516J-16 TaxID=2932253 RepID=UPI001FD02427|nr:hypothetical protein [Hymenobacter sp. 5516J-16]UOQ77445.1 hypothetical protein MUN84_01645 [Hymenobacter sp. 5516J-16]